jgi:hypothetical protein
VPTSFIADVIHQHPVVACCPEAEKLLLKAYRWHSSARRDTRKVGGLETGDWRLEIGD